MKHLRRKTRKSLVRNPRFAIGTPEFVFLGALLVLTLAQVRRLQRGYVVCDSFVKCVTGSYLVSVTQLPYIYQRLTLMCDRCDRCDSFFEVVFTVFFKTLFFL